MSKSKIKFIAIILVIIAILGTATGLIGYYSNGFTDWSKFNPMNWFKSQNEQTKDNSGSVLNLITNNGLSFVSNKIPYSAFSANGIADTADSAYNLTATIKPSIADNKNVCWSARWSNVSSEWSQDKDIADYIIFDKPITQSGESVVLTCLQDFGEQILITASAEADSTKKAICSVDYQKRIKSLSFAFKYDNNNIDNVNAEADGVYRLAYTGELKSYTIEPIPVYSAYTIDISYSSVITGKFTDTFGVGSDISLNSISLLAGLNAPKKEAELSSDAVNFIQQTRNIYLFQNVFSMISGAKQIYDRLSEAEKSHSKIVNAFRAWSLCADAFSQSGLAGLTADIINEKNAIIDSYVAPSLNYTFMNSIEFSSIDTFLEKALACNNANQGVVEYFVKYSSGDFVYDYKVAVGFTSQSLQAVSDIEIDNDKIII